MSARGDYGRLTTKEREVLLGLVFGLSAQEISDELCVSIFTIRTHIRTMLMKFNVRSQVGAVAVAHQGRLARVLEVS